MPSRFLLSGNTDLGGVYLRFYVNNMCIKGKLKYIPG